MECGDVAERVATLSLLWTTGPVAPMAAHDAVPHRTASACLNAERLDFPSYTQDEKKTARASTAQTTRQDPLARRREDRATPPL
jgi:hypothetical protein